MAKSKPQEWAEVFLDSGIDVPGRTIYLKGDIDDDTLDIVTSGFHLMPKNQPVTVIVNSGGGDTWAGMGIYDTIKAHGADVTVRVVGKACSMACVILQAGAIREATANSVLMHHVGEVEYASNHPRNFKELSKFSEKHDERIDVLMLARVNEKMKETKKTLWTMTKWKERDTWDRWFFPEDAIEMGLLDRIYEG